MNEIARRVGRRAQIRTEILMKNLTRSLWPVVGSVAITLLVLAALVTLLAQSGPVTRLEVAAIAAAVIGTFGWSLLAGMAIATRILDRRGRREAARQIIQDRVDAGQLVRIPGGGLLEAGWAEARKLHQAGSEAGR